MIVLNESISDAQLRKLVRMISLEEEPSGVTKNPWLNEDHIRDGSLDPLKHGTGAAEILGILQYTTRIEAGPVSAKGTLVTSEIRGFRAII